MCSLTVMPAELLVGRSPPAAYSGHHFFCANSLLATAASQSPTIIGSSLTSTTTTSTIVSDTSTPVATVNRILRPCLSSGLSKLSQPAVEDSSLCKNNSNQSTTSNIKTTIKTTSTITTSGFNNIGYKQKKKVVFADDRGRPLTQVRVMSDTLYPLPQWMQNSFYLKDFSQDEQPNLNSWALCFQQPASDYLTFKNKLEQHAICLEQVTISQKDDACLTGTVKVKNLAYDKQVIIRATHDHWTTHEDIFCTYVDVRHQQVHAKNSNSSEMIQQQRQPLIHNLYDTFRFQTYLPLKSDCVEFCVCYRVNGMEYWDNNDGKNYSIKRQSSKELSPHLSAKTLEKIQQVAATNILLPLSLSNLVIDNQCVNHQQIKNKQMEKMKLNNVRAWSSEFTYWQYVNDDKVPYW